MIAVQVGRQTHVLLYNFTNPFLVEVLLEIVLDVQLHRSTTAKSRALSVFGDGEGAAGGGLPDILFVVVVLGGDLHPLGDEIRGVESDTELTCVMSQCT